MLKSAKPLFYFYLGVLPFTKLLDSNIPFTLGSISIINGLYVGIYGAAFALLLVQILMENKFRVFENPVINLSFVLFGFVVIGKIFMTDSPAAYFIEYQYYIVLILFGFILLNVDLSEEVVSRIFVATGILVGILGLYSFATNEYFHTLTPEQMRAYRLFFLDRHRLAGIFSNPNVAAYYFLVMWMIALCKKELLLSWMPRGLYTSFMLLMLLCLGLTFSRSAYILLFMLMGLQMLLGKGSKVKYVLIGLGVLGGLSVLSQFIYIFQQKDIVENMRLAKWNIGLEFFFNHFFFGTPLEERLALSLTSTSEQRYTFSDNEYIKVFARFGILGGIPFVILVFGWLYKGAKELFDASTMQNRFLLYSALVFVVGSFFNNFLEFFPVTMYLLLGITQYRSAPLQSTY